jgi:hypothetical protein
MAFLPRDAARCLHAYVGSFRPGIDADADLESRHVASGHQKPQSIRIGELSGEFAAQPLDEGMPAFTAKAP